MPSNSNLPPHIQKVIMSFMHEVDGEHEIKDIKGFALFIAENISEYPELKEPIKIDESAVVEHYERTGEVPPGIKLVEKTQEEGSNVVNLVVLHGPISPKP